MSSSSSGSSSTASDRSEMEKNVDSLFKVYTIPEVANSLHKLKYTENVGALLPLF